MNTQPLLFSEPAIAETGVWCTLTEGIDPAEWANVCRKIGQLTPDRFAEAQDFLNTKPVKKQRFLSHLRTFLPFTANNPDSLRNRLKRVFCFDRAEVAHLPLVCLGPEGLDK